MTPPHDFIRMTPPCDSPPYLVQVQIHLLDSEIVEVIRRVKGIDASTDLPIADRKIFESDFPKFFTELCAGDTPDLVEETINALFKSMDAVA